MSFKIHFRKLQIQIAKFRHALHPLTEWLGNRKWQR